MEKNPQFHIKSTVRKKSQNSVKERNGFKYQKKNTEKRN
jgi:hypothetical protein